MSTAELLRQAGRLVPVGAREGVRAAASSQSSTNLRTSGRLKPLEPGSDPFAAIQETHPKLGVTGRFALQNLSGGRPEVVLNTLQKWGLEGRQTGDFDFAVREPGGQWYKLDPSGGGLGERLQDVTDVIGGVVTGIGQGIGAAGGGAAGATVGPVTGFAGAVGGAGIGGGVAEAGLNVLGKLAGLEVTPGSAARAVGAETAYGAGGELGGRLLFKGAKALYHGAVPASVREYVGRQASRVVGGGAKNTAERLMSEGRLRPAEFPSGAYGQVGRESLEKTISEPGLAREATESLLPKGAQIHEVPTELIDFDPKGELQFKLGTNARGEQNPLQGEWDPLKAGVVTLWKDKNGKFWPANGHHRVAAAKDRGVKAVNAFVLDEKDGITKKMAREIGARQNIAEGAGTPRDWGVYFRDSGMTQEAARDQGLLRSAAQRRAFDVARGADDQTFAAFSAGRINELQAEAITKYGGKNPALARYLLRAAIEKEADPTHLQSLSLILERRIKDIPAERDIFGELDIDMSKIDAEAEAFTSKVRELQRAKRGIGIEGESTIGEAASRLSKEQAEWRGWRDSPSKISEIQQALAREAGEEIPGKALADDVLATKPGTPVRTQVEAPLTSPELDRIAKATELRKGVKGAQATREGIREVASKFARVVEGTDKVAADIQFLAKDGTVQVARRAQFHLDKLTPALKKGFLDPDAFAQSVRDESTESLVARAPFSDEERRMLVASTERHSAIMKLAQAQEGFHKGAGLKVDPEQTNKLQVFEDSPVTRAGSKRKGQKAYSTLDIGTIIALKEPGKGKRWIKLANPPTESSQSTIRQALPEDIPLRSTQTSQIPRTPPPTTQEPFSTPKPSEAFPEPPKPQASGSGLRPSGSGLLPEEAKSYITDYLGEPKSKMGPKSGGRGTLRENHGTGLRGEIDPGTLAALSRLAGMPPSGVGRLGQAMISKGQAMQRPQRSVLHPRVLMTGRGVRGILGLGGLGFMTGGTAGAALGAGGYLAARKLRAPAGRVLEGLGKRMLADNGQTLARFAEATGVPAELREAARAALRHGQRGPSAYRAAAYIFLKSPEYRRWESEQSK